METILNYIAEHHLGELVNIASLLVSLIGFAATLWNLLRTKKAAERAEAAVRRMRAILQRSDAIMEVTSAIRIMEEIKRLHRNGDWKVLLDRYTTIRSLLIAIKSSNPLLVDEHKAVLTGAIRHFTDMENKVERALATSADPPSVARLNPIVSSQIDRLSEVLGNIRQEVGHEEYVNQADQTDTATASELAQRQSEMGKDS